MKKWFKKHYQWVIGVVLIPLFIAFLSLINLSPSNQNVQNISTHEISGGVIGNNNTFNVMKQKFSEEHIKLIKRRRDYINENIDRWYKYEDGKKYLYHFNILVDDLLSAAKDGNSILFQEILREIHFLSFRLERNNEIKKIVTEEPGMQFYPNTNTGMFLDYEKRGFIGGKIMNLLTRGVDAMIYFPNDSVSQLHLDSLYVVPESKKMNVLKFDTIFNYTD